MTAFVVGVPVVTRTSAVTVDGGVAPGLRVFTLVVEDNDGNQSAPARAVVQVVLRRGRGTGGTTSPGSGDRG
ncbi:MAG TPA: hypothetical protein VGA30_03925 [Actinomycetota bacterium]